MNVLVALLSSANVYLGLSTALKKTKHFKRLMCIYTMAQTNLGSNLPIDFFYLNSSLCFYFTVQQNELSEIKI